MCFSMLYPDRGSLKVLRKKKLVETLIIKFRRNIVCVYIPSVISTECGFSVFWTARTTVTKLEAV